MQCVDLALKELLAASPQPGALRAPIPHQVNWTSAQAAETIATW
jgi:hypothetical protein